MTKQTISGRILKDYKSMLRTYNQVKLAVTPTARSVGGKNTGTQNDQHVARHTGNRGAMMDHHVSKVSSSLA